MSNTSQGIYAPLPQSLSSDTEEEEELHNILTNQTSKLKSANNYQNGDSESNGYLNYNHSTVSDDTTVIKDGYKLPMSLYRKLTFTGSILLCFLIVVVFLWILPCGDDATCPVGNRVQSMSSWEKPYHGIELMGSVIMVPGRKGANSNLVFLYRNDIVNLVGLNDEGSKGGGVISIIASTGKVDWYLSSGRLPTEIDCTLLDVNNDGRTDCIVSGDNGLLQTLNPLSGTVYWNVHIHNTTQSTFTSIDFPLLITDVNDDKINDLLTVCSLNKNKHNLLVIISGYLGRVLGHPYKTDCDSINNLEVDQSYITFSCQIGTETKQTTLPLHDFYSEVFNQSITKPNVIVKQHAHFRFRNRDRMIYSLNGWQLIIHNQGSCPWNCSVNVRLINHSGNVTWFYKGFNVYGMIPTSLTINNSEPLQGHVNGFLLKFWHWSKTERNLNQFRKRNLIGWYLPTLQIKRNLQLNISEQLLTERVVLITFNSSNYNVVNVSQSDLKQLCFEQNCQPELKYQENSVFISDLDGDGAKELVSYSTTFLNGNDLDKTNPKYHLQSIIKVIRLESELPKLYESVVTKY